jgi:hypothetical protein
MPREVISSGPSQTVAKRGSVAGLFNHRPGWRLTPAAKLLLLLTGLAGTLLLLRCIEPFLSVTHRLKDPEYLVVEGWIGNSGLKRAAAEFSAGHYQRLLTSGCMRTDEEAPASSRNFANWSAEDLQKLNIPAERITAVPTWEDRKDRTWHSALALKHWFDQNRIPVKRLEVVSLGAHSRRTRLLYEKAFGKTVQIGIIAARDNEYDPAHWWSTSEGVREVVGESIAYLYARIFFHP